MTVFTQAFNLSDNVKYMNFKIDTTPSGGGNATERTSLQDRKDLMHKIQEFITTEWDNQQIPTNNTLGWQRIDGADSAGAILHNSDGVYNNKTGDAVYGFLRSKCYDYSTTGHWKYVRLKLFERNEDSCFGATDTGQRYKSSPSVLVLRYDLYADWPGITNEDSAAVIDSINGGSNVAEADGYPGTDLNAGQRNGILYGTENAPIGFDAAYNSALGMASTNWSHPPSGYNTWKYVYVGDRNGNSGMAGYSHPISKDTASSLNTTTVSYMNNTTAEFIPGGKKGNGLAYHFFPEFFGVNGFGDSDLSEKVSYGELKLIIDGNGTLWGFGDQDRTGTGGVDSASGSSGYKGVNASGADARYLAIFSTQHQDDNPEKNDEYSTILFAGEYKKEFGEPVNTGYIHNGIKLNAHNFLMNNGVATPPNFMQAHTTNWGYNTRFTTAGPQGVGNSSSFQQNFNAITNIGDHTGALTNYSAISNKSADDATNNTGNYQGLAQFNNSTGNTNVNNVSDAEGTGHAFMGDEVWSDAQYGYGSTQNRSRSIGSTHRYSRGDNSWKSRNLGNTAKSNTVTNVHGPGSYAGQYGSQYPWLGYDGAQFCLTEYPTRTDAVASSLTGDINTRESIQRYNNYTAPSSGREHLSATRLHMGYLGYVGHESKYKAFSLNELFFGARHNMFGDDGFDRFGQLSEDIPGDPARQGTIATLGAGLPLVADYYDSAASNLTIDSDAQQREWVQEFHPIPMSDSTYSVYEPVLSVGLTRALHMNRIKSEYSTFHSGTVSDAVGAQYGPFDYSNLVSYYAQSNANQPTGNVNLGEKGTPGGINKKKSAFAMLGRTYGIKIFGPYRHDKYNFLDAVSIQIDDDEFYAVNPNNPVDHWVVPMNHDQCAFLLKK